MGVYVRNSPAALNAYEAWLGRDVDAVHGVVGGAYWTDFTSSVGRMVNNSGPASTNRFSGRFP
jgi:hypothetical protein